MLNARTNFVLYAHSLINAINAGMILFYIIINATVRSILSLIIISRNVLVNVNRDAIYVPTA